MKVEFEFTTKEIAAFSTLKRKTENLVRAFAIADASNSEAEKEARKFKLPTLKSGLQKTKKKWGSLCYYVCEDGRLEGSVNISEDIISGVTDMSTDILIGLVPVCTGFYGSLKAYLLPVEDWVEKFFSSPKKKKSSVTKKNSGSKKKSSATVSEEVKHVPSSDEAAEPEEVKSNGIKLSDEAAELIKNAPTVSMDDLEKSCESMFGD